MHWYFLISSYYLTVLNGCSLTILKSIEVTQCSGSFEWGFNRQIYPKSANFELTCHFMLCHIEKHRGHSVLWQFWTGSGGGSISRFTLNLPILNSLAVSWLCFTEGLFVLHTKDLIKEWEGYLTKTPLTIHEQHSKHKEPVGQY